jgi:hypothetical protein
MRSAPEDGVAEKALEAQCLPTPMWAPHALVRSSSPPSPQHRFSSCSSLSSRPPYVRPAIASVCSNTNRSVVLGAFLDTAVTYHLFSPLIEHVQIGNPYLTSLVSMSLPVCSPLAFASRSPPSFALVPSELRPPCCFPARSPTWAPPLGLACLNWPLRSESPRLRHGRLTHSTCMLFPSVAAS